MPNLPCPACNNPAPLVYQAADYNKLMSDKVFDYYRCSRDGLMFIGAVPTDLARYYPNEYYEVPEDHAAMVRLAETLQRWKLDLVKRHKQTGRLLEIGPAYGLFSYLAKRDGFDVAAIEMDARCCAFLRSTVGIDVVETDDPVGALDALPQFDVIVMWQVLEHLPNPFAALKAIAARLAPGGILVLDTPNPNAFQFKVMGHRWAHLDAPRHLQLIPSELLGDKLAEAGLETVHVTSADRGANGFNGFGWAFSFKQLLGNGGIGRVGHLAGRLLAKLLIPIERTGHRGSTYTAVFRKPG